MWGKLKQCLMQCEDYVLVNGILFRIRYDKEDKGEPSLVLCIPEKYVWNVKV